MKNMKKKKTMKKKKKEKGKGQTKAKEEKTGKNNAKEKINNLFFGTIAHLKWKLHQDFSTPN